MPVYCGSRVLNNNNVTPNIANRWIGRLHFEPFSHLQSQGWKEIIADMEANDLALNEQKAAFDLQMTVRKHSANLSSKDT